MNIRPRERKLIITVGIAAVLFVVPYYVVLPLWSTQAGGRDDLQLAQKELRRQQELIASKPPSCRRV
jgi:type II secretory pathway component PulM